MSVLSAEWEKNVLELNVVDSAIEKVSLPCIRKCHRHKGVESVDFVDLCSMIKYVVECKRDSETVQVS